MTAPTYGAVVTQGAHPSGGVLSFTQPAGDAFAFVVVPPLNTTPTTPAGFTLLGSRTVDYVDVFVYGRNGGAGSTVTVGNLTNQAAIAGVSFNAPKADWLTTSALAVGPDGSLSQTTGQLPEDALLLSFLAATDNTTAIVTTAPSGMTKRGEVSAEFFFRHAAVATSTPSSRDSQSLDWGCATPAGASFTTAALAVPGVLTGEGATEVGATILVRSADGTTWERRKIQFRNAAGTGWDWAPAAPAATVPPAPTTTVEDMPTVTVGLISNGDGGSPLVSKTVQRRTGTGSWGTLATVAGAATQYLDTTAVDGTQYGYRHLVRNGTTIDTGNGPGASAWSPEVTITTA